MFDFKTPCELVTLSENGAENRFECTALICEESSLDPSSFGVVDDHRVILLTSPCAPRVGDLIALDASLLDIARVRVCRNLDGAVVCYRLALA